MLETGALPLGNAEAVPFANVPRLDLGRFRDAIVAAVEGGIRVASFFAFPDGDSMRLVAVLASSEMGRLGLLSTHAAGPYPAITPDCPQLHWFEREMAELWRIRPEGHPWLKPIRQIAGRPYPFFKAEGAEMHEVAVGPVHAGVIEPGHFRFQCQGEQVMHLEIALGYQHRGIEKALVGGPSRRTLCQMETLAGDTTVGHTTAHAQVMEALGGLEISPRAEVLRGVALELERLANHTGDLGALAGDVGYLPGASFFGRLRGDFLNMTALICGSRFGRGLVRPGGAGFDISPEMVWDLIKRLDAARKGVEGAADLLFKAPSVLGRFVDTGRVWRSTCQALGLVGPAARACGVDRDVRFEFPAGVWRARHIPVATWHSGDVFARAYVRWIEMNRSMAFIHEILQELPSGAVLTPVEPPRPDLVAVSLVEGWRGEICHVAITDAASKFSAYKIVDPSFHNWMGVAMAMTGEQVSDFPLCNKSFNLSYCGHDL